MINKIILFIALHLFSAYAFASAYYSVSETTLDTRGNTLTTACLNTKGFYVEIGHPNKKIPYKIQGFARQIPLSKAIENSLYPGWKLQIGPAVDLSQKIIWIGKEEWTQWLRKMAFDKNLALIVDWRSKTLFVNQL